MTAAIEIFRHSEDGTRLRAGFLLDRLAIHEDRRRAALLQRARPALELPLARALQAWRPICPDRAAGQYRADIALLAGSTLSELDAWLEGSGLDEDSRSAWFDHAREALGVFRTEDGWFTDRAYLCELHEVWYSCDTASHEVTVRWQNGFRGTETWSDDAVEEAAFYCDGSQRYYASSAFDAGRTADNDTVCEAWAELNGYWSDGDGYWRNDDRYDEDDDGCPIPSYHDADRLWSVENARLAAVAYYGLEIELCFGSESDRLDFYDELGFPTADLTAERDGSLDEDAGLEVITRPFTLLELRQHRNPLQQALEVADRYDVACPSPSGYGVHITTNAQRLTVDHRQRLVDATYDMRGLTEFVAGRKSNPDYYSYNKGCRGGEKYTAVNERSDGSFEFRVFQGTSAWPVLLSYIEYVDALTEWTRNPANPTQGPIGQALFRAWTHATGRYPGLSRRFTTTLTQEALACALPSLSRAA